jgi:hypothetical protein
MVYSFNNKPGFVPSYEPLENYKTAHALQCVMLSSVFQPLRGRSILLHQCNVCSLKYVILKLGDDV